MPKHRRPVPDVGAQQYVGVVAFDVGSTHSSHCALGAKVKPNGGIRILPLGMGAYPISKEASERAEITVDRIKADKDVYDMVHDFNVEQQVPVLPPEHMMRKMNPKAAQGVRDSHAANVVAYGISQNLIGSLKQAYPDRIVNSVSPQHKFGILGIHKPVSKQRRKTRATHFFHSWLLHHAHKKRWQPFIKKFTTKDDGELRKKRDDPSDAFCTALARLFEILAKNIDLRKVKGGIAGLRARMMNTS